MKEQLNNHPHMNELAANKLTRRNALKLTFFAGAGLAASTSVGQALAAGVTPVNNFAVSSELRNQLGFEPVPASLADSLTLASGYGYNVIRKRGDWIVGGEYFGEHNDFTAYFPINYLQGGNSSSDGLLWVNHEYYAPLFISGRAFSVNPTFEQYALERSMLGGTVMRVTKNAGGGWDFVDDSTYNRRVSGWTICDLDGPVAGSGPVFGATEVQGTVANCGGGMTPWGTALTAEENFQDYAADASRGGYGWGKDVANDGRYFTDEHYGWIVEIDPFNKDRRPVKHTALGRFRHEGATTTLGKSGRAVVYSGYDRADYSVFKFISDGVYNPADRASNLKLLSSGKLYAADFENGKWLEITPNDPKIAARYKTVEDVLVNAGEAAILAGATRCDRPEDIKVNPQDNSVFIAMTNNAGHGNYHGHITRIFEAGGNAEALEFGWEVFANGGPQSTAQYSSPDNLSFDQNGNLWVFCDTSSNRAGKGIYSQMGNNGIFVIPTTGPFAGIAYRFGNGPVECEVTGPSRTPDYKTLFMSVQHPGENSPSLTQLTSNWPEGGSAIPKSSVVAITGF